MTQQPHDPNEALRAMTKQLFSDDPTPMEHVVEKFNERLKSELKDWNRNSRPTNLTD